VAAGTGSEALSGPGSASLKGLSALDRDDRPIPRRGSAAVTGAHIPTPPGPCKGAVVKKLSQSVSHPVRSAEMFGVSQP